MFDAGNWHWYVAGDETRAWSSAVSAYVPSSSRLDGTVTRIVSEAELSDVLAIYGLIGPDLLVAKKTASKLVSLEAEALRALYITPGSGKAMSYQQVAQEAIHYGATNGAGAYPFLQARVDSGRYASLSAAATATQAIQAQWAAIGSAIDRFEDAAKLSIAAATTVDQVRAATQVPWP